MRSYARLGWVVLIVGCGGGDVAPDADATSDGESSASTAADTVDGEGDTTAGDGDGDGDGTSGDGDGTAGDGDGTSGDGDGTSGDGDGTSGDGDGTSGDGDGTTGGCFNEQYVFNRHPPTIMFVLDQSDSMETTYDHDANPGTPDVSRWNALHIAVTDILTQYDAQVEFGVKLFPNPAPCTPPAGLTPQCCVNPGVDVPAATNNAAAILSAIPGATANMYGLTPAGWGLEHAHAYLSGLASPGAKAVIFMADGATTDQCGSPNSVLEIEDMLRGAYNDGNDPSVPTYVIGINAGPSTADELHEFAAAGGVPVPGMPGTPVWSDGFETGDLTASAWTQTGGQSDWTVDGSDAWEGSYSAISQSLSVQAPSMFDGFETGDFTGGAWSFGGNADWVVDGTDVFTGSFSAHSGAITDGQTSDLILDVVLSEPGWLAFEHRESTEAGLDQLLLEVDGMQVGKSSGDAPWTTLTHLLDPGPHTVTFRYEKSPTGSANADAIWIDDVRIEGADSTLSVDVDLPADGHVWFSHREAGGGQDGLVFSIDGVAQATWLDVYPWEDDYFALSAGTHTLDWTHYAPGGGPETVRVDAVRVESGSWYPDQWFYDAQSTADFYAALDQIIGELVTCDLVLDPPPPYPDDIIVEVDGTTVLQLDPGAAGFDCTTDDGWYYSSPDVVTLCGQVCQEFKLMPTPTADVEYSCMPG